MTGWQEATENPTVVSKKCSKSARLSFSILLCGNTGLAGQSILGLHNRPIKHNGPQQDVPLNTNQREKYSLLDYVAVCSSALLNI